jgi:hypothetical protein
MFALSSHSVIIIFILWTVWILSGGAIRPDGGQLGSGGGPAGGSNPAC